MKTTLYGIRHYRHGLLLGLALLCSGAQLAAETVVIPLGQQAQAWGVETPKTGLTKAQVEARFGSPKDVKGPVGDPPIYTWDYGQFAVYFEQDRVIHSVVKHKGQP